MIYYIFWIFLVSHKWGFGVLGFWEPLDPRPFPAFYQNYSSQSPTDFFKSTGYSVSSQSHHFYYIEFYSTSKFTIQISKIIHWTLSHYFVFSGLIWFNFLVKYQHLHLQNSTTRPFIYLQQHYFLSKIPPYYFTTINHHHLLLFFIEFESPYFKSKKLAELNCSFNY